MFRYPYKVISNIFRDYSVGQPMDKASYRNALAHLKKKNANEFFSSSFADLKKKNIPRLLKAITELQNSYS